MKLISFVLLLAIGGACSAAATTLNEVDANQKQLKNQCAAFTYHTLKPFMDYLYQLKTTIEENENKYLIKDKQIIELRKNLTDLSLSKDKEINELRVKNIQYEAIINEFRNQMNDLPEKVAAIKCDGYINEIANKSKTIADQNQKISNLTTQVQADAVKLHNFDKEVKESGIKLKECEELTAINKEKPSSCIPYGNYPGIHEIKVSTSPPFEVLCDSAIAGPGWTVIQQRINGKEDFNRSWTTYREGFGSFDGDFFLGLENIHELTNSQQHKLYIYMEKFDGKIVIAQYDNFKIAAEADNYRLISLGEFSGNEKDDWMRFHENKQFSTFDRDHDSWEDGNCAIERHGGWWYGNNDYFDLCADCNLNGKYFDSAVQDKQSVYWFNWFSLKKVKMLIRPKSD